MDPFENVSTWYSRQRPIEINRANSAGRVFAEIALLFLMVGAVVAAVTLFLPALR